MADKRIQAAPAALPNDFRVAAYYIDVHGYTYAETAAMLNIPHGTVMSRLARGRKRLRVALAHVAALRGNFAVVERRIAYAGTTLHADGGGPAI